MRILAIDRLLPGITADNIRPHLRKEAKAAWNNYEKGLFREIYMRGDRPGAVIILECKDVVEAKNIMSELPLVKEKLIEFDFIPLEPFSLFASLFEK